MILLRRRRSLELSAADLAAELDELRDLGHKGRQFIAAMEERERKRTGIGSLKIRYNQIFGYYVEISQANAHLAPADYERKQTLANAESYTMRNCATTSAKCWKPTSASAKSKGDCLRNCAPGLRSKRRALRRDGRGHRPARCACEFCARGGRTELCAAGIQRRWRHDDCCRTASGDRAIARSIAANVLCRMICI